MNPFYFGTSRRPLFGVYHPPRTRAPRATGVVLCYPLWQEYMRAHRAFRQLAILLSKAGFPVLRFDYFGTGDSGGDGESGDVAQWVTDVRTAIDELKDTAGVRSVTLVGLRIGAVLAAMAPADRTDVDRVVLWDPVIDGAGYVDDLIASLARDVAAGEAPAADAAGDVLGIKGFPLTRSMRDALCAVNLQSLTPVPAGRLSVIVSEEREEYAGFHRSLVQRGARAELRVVPSAGNWGEVDRWGSALLPQAIIQGIVACIDEASVA
jgi:pimeloyl-ACP methyl ester carboxylesterase